MVWIPVGATRNERLWERVGSVARAKVDSMDGICSVAATSVPTRQRSGGFLGNFLGRIRGKSADKLLSLPDGRLVEPCGRRRIDVVLAWAAEPLDSLDEERVRAHWPTCESIRKLRENLFVVYGVGIREALVPEAVQPIPTPAASSSPESCSGGVRSTIPWRRVVSMARASDLSTPSSRAICNPERFSPMRYEQATQVRSG